MSANPRLLRKRFGQAIRETRLAKGLTQMALAENAGLTLNFVGEIERGESLASIETAVKLASGLGLTGAELFKLLDAKLALG